MGIEPGTQPGARKVSQAPRPWGRPRPYRRVFLRPGLGSRSALCLELSVCWVREIGKAPPWPFCTPRSRSGGGPENDSSRVC